MDVSAQVASELNKLLWLLGGGMSLLILREVFRFIQSFVKSRKGDDLGSPDKTESFRSDVKVAHALQGSCLQRLEQASVAQTAALIEITAALRRMNTGHNE